MSDAPSSSLRNPTVDAGDLKLPKLSHVVASRLREQIAQGQIRPGTRLPPESELLAIFKVSRPTLREALRILEAESLISIGRGARSGASVSAPSFDKAGEYASFFLASTGATLIDLHEARMLFEPGIVRLIGDSPSEEVVSELRKCIDGMADDLEAGNFVAVVKGTSRFHALLADASGNQAITLFIRMLQSITDETYVQILIDDRSHPQTLHKNMSKTVAGYRTLCDLLQRGKGEEAGAFWHRYMDRSRDFLLRSRLGQQRIIHRDSVAR